MKNVFLFICFCILNSCTKKETEEVEPTFVKKENVDFYEGSHPENFKAKRMDGKEFDAKNYLGKNLVIVINKVDFEGKMSDDFNELIDKHKKDNVEFVLIVDGDIKPENKLDDVVSMYDSSAIFIDNRSLPYKNESQIKHSLHYWPASILMDTKGDVVRTSCGGYGFADEYKRKLDSLIASN